MGGDFTFLRDFKPHWYLPGMRRSGNLRGSSAIRFVQLLPAAVILVTLFYIPLAYLFNLSLHENIPGRMIVEPGRTLANYFRVVTDTYYLMALARTLTLATSATLICALLGFPLACFLWRANPRFKGILTLSVIAPLLISIVVRAYGWMIILGDRGLVNHALLSLNLIEQPIPLMYTNEAIFVGLIHVQFPFMVLSILAALERVDSTLVDAAETLGASRFKAFMEIVLPLSLPGIITGTVLVFSLCMTAFVTPVLLGGSGDQLLTIIVYNQFTTAFNWPLGSALAIVLCIITLVAVSLFLVIMRKATVLKRIEQAGLR